jgi:hypothetical protein
VIVVRGDRAGPRWSKECRHGLDREFVGAASQGEGSGRGSAQRRLFFKRRTKSDVVVRRLYVRCTLSSRRRLTYKST